MLDNKHPYGNMAVLVNAPKAGLGAPRRRLKALAFHEHGGLDKLRYQDVADRRSARATCWCASAPRR